MDTYLRSIIRKWGDAWESRAPEEVILQILTDNDLSPYPAHWFANCRMFHASPCEDCEYKFKCYTN